MSYTFFNKEVSKYYSYILLSVYHKGRDNCGVYNKDENGKEYITSILTGEKFYSIKDFVIDIKGYEMIDELYECFFYDEEINKWIPIEFI